MHDPQTAFFADRLAKADIALGGERPWDVAVHDERLWSRLLLTGTLGLGESYMDGWWDAPALDQLIYNVITGNVQGGLPRDLGLYWSLFKGIVLNRQRSRPAEVGRTALRHRR